MDVLSTPKLRFSPRPSKTRPPSDAGKKNVSLAPFLAQLRAFLNHAQLNKGDTVRRLLAENGAPQGLVEWVVQEKWWNLRQEDLSRWTQDQRDDLRIWIDLAGMLQIVALEADPVLEYHNYTYDAAGSLVQDSFQVYGAPESRYDYPTNDNSHLAGFWQSSPPYGNPLLMESYAHDHLNRRVVKQGALTGTIVYHYDLQGNLIAESKPDGTILREWVYLNGQRLAMILPAEGGGGVPCGGPGSCRYSVAGEGGGSPIGAVALLLGPAFIALGLKYHRRKYTIAGLTFIGGALCWVMIPKAQSQTTAEQIFYYHNDHLGTPRVLTDETGAVVWDVDYSPFGEISNYVTNTLPVDQPFRFPGHYADSLTGMYYNLNRYYLPEVGRYNRVDPILAIIISVVSKPVFSNQPPYVYSKNNPILFLDLAGLRTCASGECPDCESGEWTSLLKSLEAMEVTAGLGIGPAGGLSCQVANVKCTSDSSLQVAVIQCCLKGGAGFHWAGAAATGVKCYGECIEDLSGGGWGTSGGGGIGPFGFGGGGSTGTMGACTSGGLGAGFGGFWTIDICYSWAR